MAEEKIPTIEESKPLVVNGVDGVWVPKWMANDIFSDIKLVPKLEKKIEDMDSLLLLRSERIENLKIGISWAEKAEMSAYSALAASDTRAQKAESKLKVWYRHPLFLISIGVVLTVGLEVGSVAVLRSI